MKFFKKNIWFMVFLIVGLLIFFYPLIFINHELMPGDLGDIRLIHYILEHGYLYITGNHIHSSFWDMPFYYPYLNTLSFSDILLGGMIIYTPLRFLIHSPFAAFQVWIVVVCILNYLCSYILLHKILKFDKIPSCIGSFFFAFCLVRYAQMYHLQLYLQFITIVFLSFLFSIKPKNSKKKNYLLFLGAGGAFALQLYTSFYLGWYIVFVFSILFILFLFFKNTRDFLFNFTKNYKIEIILTFVFTFILLLPLLYHYLLVEGEFGYFTIHDIKPINLVSSQSIFLNFFVDYSFLNYWQESAETLSPAMENFLGVGYLTTIFIIIGILINKKERFFILSIVIISLLSFGVDRIHRFLYDFYPAASAIRITSRIIFALIPLYVYSLCYFLSKIKNKYLVAACAILIMIEQIPNIHNFNWTIDEHYRRQEAYTIPDECRVFGYRGIYDEGYTNAIWKYELDIMWLSSDKGIRTINGYSGYNPEVDFSAIKNPKCLLYRPKFK